MKITKNTQVCISIAGRPGNLGANLFNASFEALSLDFIYKPFQVSEDKLSSAVDGIRSFGIRGCGVSMPHKVTVLEYLDEIDSVAEKIGAVNTIVNSNRVLRGYNTDFEGARMAVNTRYNINKKKVFVIGAGGAARAIIMALKESQPGEIYITNRDEVVGEQVAKEFNLRYFPYNNKDNFEGDFLINATSVGMLPYSDEMIITNESLRSYEAVMDVVVYPNTTLLIKSAKEYGKVVIPGFEMALYQAAAQFKLYTNQEAPLNIMRESMDNFYKTEMV